MNSQCSFNPMVVFVQKGDSPTKMKVGWAIELNLGEKL